jgi:hypothetical protein
MTPARSREILRSPSWSVPNLAQILAIQVEAVQRWHDATEPIPNVGKWLRRGSQAERSLPLHHEHPTLASSSLCHVLAARAPLGRGNEGSRTGGGR